MSEERLSADRTDVASTGAAGTGAAGTNAAAHTLLVLGASEEFIELVRLARERNVRTVVCDGRPGAPAKAGADLAVDIPVTSHAKIAQLCRREGVDGIVTGFSDLLLECATHIAHLAELPFYLRPEQLPFYRDKSVMKEMFHKLGIGCARHVVLHAGDSDEDKAPDARRPKPATTLADLRFPVVAKPTSLYGSRGVTVLHSPDELREHARAVFAETPDEPLLVEEYNEGFEFNLMSWVRGGTVHILGIADREKTPLGPRDIPYSCRNIYPSRLQPQVEAEALDILQRIVGYTGQREGELSMQFFWQPGGRIEVCEVAARFLGYEHELIAYAGGLSLEELMLDATYDEPALDALLARNNPRLPRSAAVLYFQGRPGTVGSLDELRRMAELTGVERLWLFYQEGEQVAPFAQPYFARCVMAAPTRAQIDQLTREAYALAHVPDAVDGVELLHQNQTTCYSI
jgi:biotin carboxylase